MDRLPDTLALAFSRDIEQQLTTSQRDVWHKALYASTTQPQPVKD